ncbi:hypothetical protein IAQ61_003492 [Plenodomus lingam]|uniref:Predicted protein n=1 Tax=Leptosphaeria maculans (strain JN3 / isolate v23.1.3 / race Av1-4-5-6-7-8) TaxID=985895 RepID=E4ZQ30_LEPMJ|nr:predicted protein [Plenodomus lingam JN3]KAH9874303.1 hypothetical protein IAQ61_003492 [Plenodomus lingam]CBX89940.1 predicted protein [Plenodomus lingam JN3]
MSDKSTPTSNSPRQAHSRSVSVSAEPSFANLRAPTSPRRPEPSSLYPKTWEYNREPVNKLPEDVKPAWGRDETHNKVSVVAPRQGHEGSRNIISPRLQPRLARLSLSEIKTITFDPIQETPPSPYHEAPPKEKSSYEYAINDLLTRTDHADQSRVTETDYYDLLSKLKASNMIQPILPLPEDRISCVGSDIPDEDEEGDVPEDSIPTYLKKHDAYETKMRLIQLRTILMRCQVLQSAVINIERKPWIPSVENQANTYYSKMRKLAYRARELAERLESRELQARCEYWAGRGHGGTHDFESAKECFALAMNLDVENGTLPNGEPRLRGLRPNEKEDVRFLFGYASQHEEEWRRRIKDVHEAAPVQVGQSNLRDEKCLDWSNISKLAWRPERDRIMGHVNLPKVVPNLKAMKPEFSNDSFEPQQIQLKAIHDVELRRRPLSDAEQRYIKKDGKRQSQRRDHTTRVGIRPTPRTYSIQSRRPEMSHASSLRSVNSSASYASFRKPLRLQDELADLGDWHARTPSSSGSCKTYTPKSELQQRRNVNLDSIDTSDFEHRMNLGKAVHGEDPEV